MQPGEKPIPRTQDIRTALIKMLVNLTDMVNEGKPVDQEMTDAFALMHQTVSQLVIMEEMEPFIDALRPGR
jgi:hypothetical protein